ncbi:hypothetical protein GGI04_003107 [Coemansia thaxteri]|nr:hypothetical protein GGI04_003107 [Coemansia thaxteri]KAJ2467221.1 hypothetical protein GGI02_004106 [Coemansia sp. RSA 2322]
MSDSAKWRALYRGIVRAVPMATLGKHALARVALAKVRQGFQESRELQITLSEQSRLYRQGWNTVGFLKLARELGSVERRIVDSILQTYQERCAAEEKPRTKKRHLQPPQAHAYDETFAEYDRIVAKVARDLDIVLPRDVPTRSLDWIPQLKGLNGIKAI